MMSYVRTLLPVYAGRQKQQVVNLTRLEPGLIGVVKTRTDDFILVRFDTREGRYWSRLNPLTCVEEVSSEEYLQQRTRNPV